MQFYVWEFRNRDGPNSVSCQPLGLRHLGDAPQCPVCRRFIGMRPWLPPYRLKIDVSASKLPDAIYDAGEIFVSKRLAASFVAAALTGLDFVETVDEQVTSLDGLKITGNSFFHATVGRENASIDVLRSDLAFGPIECSTCRSIRQVARAKRLVIEAQSWESLDVFVARGLPGITFVTDRFKNLVETLDFDNITLRRAEAFSFNYMPWLS